MAPLAWVRRIFTELPELEFIPLFGNAPSFDWGHFTSLLASRFGISDLQIRTKHEQWRDEVEKNLGTHLFTLPISVAPLGSVFWVMSQEDMGKLTSSIMKTGHKSRPVSSEILQEGFYRYLALETLNAIQPMQPFQKLTLQLSEEEPNFGKSFCIDVEIELEGKSCWGRLIIPAEFRSAWVNHFSDRPSEYISTEIARNTQLVIGVKTGSVVLDQEEWKNLRKGDFVLLDRGSYDPYEGKGIALLTVQSTPLFNVKIKHNQIELVDYAFYYEDNMDQKRDVPSEASEKFPTEEGEVVALKELPLYVTVEIARLKITLDQLMHLTPGHMLELPIHPDQGVSLCINGQKVGRAELVYLGEKLGIRILEIG